MRRIALIELADLEEPEALPWLARALTGDAAAAVRAEAARLLEAWEEPDVVQALCQALADSDESVREAAAQSLSELKTAEAGRLLLPWAAHADTFVRRSALRALRELRLEESVNPALAALDVKRAAAITTLLGGKVKAPKPVDEPAGGTGPGSEKKPEAKPETKAPAAAANAPKPEAPTAKADEAGKGK